MWRFQKTRQVQQNKNSNEINSALSFSGGCIGIQRNNLQQRIKKSNVKYINCIVFTVLIIILIKATKIIHSRALSDFITVICLININGTD